MTEELPGPSIAKAGCQEGVRWVWPLLSGTKIQEKADSAPAQAPPPGTARTGACPYAHLRHTWLVMVEAASRLQTELAFQTWLAKSDHRAF